MSEVNCLKYTLHNLKNKINIIIQTSTDKLKKRNISQPGTNRSAILISILRFSKWNIRYSIINFFAQMPLSTSEYIMAKRKKKLVNISFSNFNHHRVRHAPGIRVVPHIVLYLVKHKYLNRLKIKIGTVTNYIINLLIY